MRIHLREYKVNFNLKFPLFKTKRCDFIIYYIYLLKALVYVSTAFAQVNNAFIEEKVHPPIADWRKMIKMAESLDEYIINIFTTK